MPTLKDLSRELGLSVTQVSRALNGHDDVSEATKERVAEAAERLGYAANISARMLKSGRSGIVAMVVTADEEQEVPEVLLAGVIGLSAEFSRRGMQFVLHVMTGDDDAVATHRKLCGSGLIDGFVLVNPVPGDPRVALLTGMNVPFVVHGRDTAGATYPYFDIDNRGLAERLAGRLIEAGHRRLALVDGPAHTAFARERHEGFLTALSRAGIDPSAAIILPGAMVESRGRAAVATLFDGPGPHPTGIVAGNTMLAAGIYAGLAERGLSVPADVSVVAHDDGLQRTPADAFIPPVTVSRSTLGTAWRPLADALVGVIEGGNAGDFQTLERPDFIEGGSVAGPAGA
ncbi:substrate-binding domain-containing protein [Rhodobacterales bacterium HKCCE3408]|nr:substrate-binding domain-containing protein [Rhodobacterales bacterium HKCCE3408]